MHLFAKHQIESVAGIAWLGAYQKSETQGMTIIWKKNKIPSVSDFWGAPNHAIPTTDSI